MRLKHKNEKLEKELDDIEKVAMNVESQANLSVLDKEKENLSLRVKLQTFLSKLLLNSISDFSRKNWNSPTNVSPNWRECSAALI
jgi:hypothetical protein